ncbi:MAG TPA: hypothetical protein IGS17_06070 [Oscillatoriales cyanobacterium M59_W2019_021]|nr:MAG: hypothetical protein D6728_03990 [Cyanobacteria bacterium J055]HIK33162.1 hypothetical protein [Oscillatoriales cyanobacterium M4454_W2019_049]HIK50479.1 hypothetical protein [Oscillatoriales cyanobacterium M59_W2019_021]
MSEYDAMRQEARAMSCRERLELDRSLEMGWKLFPWECRAQFRIVSGVEILCLTSSQMESLFAKHSYLQEHYPQIEAIEDDPIPQLLW